MRRTTLRSMYVTVGLALLTAAASAQGSGARPFITKVEFERWQRELSNWGRWGQDNELGALNLITPAKRRQAAALVKDGVTVSLAVDANEVKDADNPNPYE